MILVAGSLWSVPHDDRPAVARRLSLAGLDRWHWDVSDGRFTVPGGFEPAEAAQIMRETGAAGEAHLMVLDPAAQAGVWAELCLSVTVHVESVGWRRAVEVIRERGCTAAVAISPETPTSSVADLPTDVGVLVMSVRPGGAGTPFDDRTPARVASLAGRRLLGVDGSVTADRAEVCAQAGANWLVSGTDLCNADDPGNWLARVRGAGNG